MSSAQGLSKTQVTAEGPGGRRKSRAVSSPGGVASALTDFAARHWERSATVLAGVHSEPLISEQTLFSALVRASQLYCLGDTSVRFSFWIDALETGDFKELLPVPDDKNLACYNERIARCLQGSEFTVLLADVHLYDEIVWSTVRPFLQQLYRLVGVPCGGVDTGVFFGRYLKTPFGVHRGQMSVLTFPVHGRKHFRLWARGYGDSHEDIRDSLEYSRHVPASFELSAGPHDILYWPADYWHIGEGTGSFTAALNIGFWWDQPPLTRVLLEMSRQLAAVIDVGDKQAASFVYNNLANGTLQDYLPASSNEVLNVTRQVLSDRLMEESLALENLQFQSCDGFRDIPRRAELSPVEWKVNTSVQAVSECLFALGSNGSLYVAANGHLFRTLNTKRVSDCLKRLQRFKNLVLDQQAVGTPEVVELLSWLVSVRSVQICNSK